MTSPRVLISAGHSTAKDFYANNNSTEKLIFDSSGFFSIPTSRFSLTDSVPLLMVIFRCNGFEKSQVDSTKTRKNTFLLVPLKTNLDGEFERPNFCFNKTNRFSERSRLAQSLGKFNIVSLPTLEKLFPHFNKLTSLN